MNSRVGFFKWETSTPVTDSKKHTRSLSLSLSLSLSATAAEDGVVGSGGIADEEGLGWLRHPARDPQVR